ncbi:CDI toxin immunity protein [Priestia endophytica]|uniref:CDI toxin immunity protein n=1 Tax=Priestia endophytica TaxID=135735 RepID=UPI00124C0B8C|nr:hypothetical protein [Priestia endophytica]KAB2494521.1 hypothetical protein F8155_08075 [Priestia endophytica]
MAPLYEECIEALGKENIEILSDEVGRKVIKQFEQCFPITQWARVEWEKVENHIQAEYLEDIEDFLEQCDELEENDFYIIWNDAMMPVVKAKLACIFDTIDDVLAVSFDTWLFSPTINGVVEFHHEGETRVGVMNLNPSSE